MWSKDGGIVALGSGSRWTCDVVGAPGKGEIGNSPSKGWWGKGKGRREEVGSFCRKAGLKGKVRRSEGRQRAA